jgi:hypothetical protein
MYPAVYRVNWLKARAKKNRWAEELVLTRNEMEWATRFFYFKSRQWAGWIENVDGPSTGQRAYADKQMAMWQNMGEEAYRQFSQACPDITFTLNDVQM